MSKGKQLLDDFLDKLGVSLRKAQEQNVITLDDLKPAWEARERLEAYLDPPRDEHGHFLNQKQANDLKPSDPEATPKGNSKSPQKAAPTTNKEGK